MIRVIRDDSCPNKFIMHSEILTNELRLCFISIFIQHVSSITTHREGQTEKMAKN